MHRYQWGGGGGGAGCLYSQLVPKLLVVNIHNDEQLERTVQNILLCPDTVPDFDDNEGSQEEVTISMSIPSSDVGRVIGKGCTNCHCCLHALA